MEADHFGVGDQSREALTMAGFALLLLVVCQSNVAEVGTG